MQEYVNYAIQSAAIYHKYATEKNSSVVRYAVASIQENSPFIDLITEAPLLSVDGLTVQIGETLYTEKDISLVTNDAKARLIRTLPATNDLRTLLLQSKSTDVFLIYDLRFLISRVEDWYRKYGQRLCIPTKVPKVKPHFSGEKAPSAEQIGAIETVLSTPFSYVWGAPGTGKTQFVLARCLLSYLKAEKPVLIVAPTNRAVEQMLYGILPYLEAAGIPQEYVLRLGTPTKEFAARYPRACENGTLLSKAEELKAAIDICKEEQRKLNQKLLLADKYERYLQSKKEFGAAAEEIKKVLDLLFNILVQYEDTEEELKELRADEKAYKRDRQSTERLLYAQKREVHRLAKKLKHRKPLEKLFPQMILRHQKLLTAEETREKNLQATLSYCERQEKETADSISRLEQTASALKEQKEAACKTIENNLEPLIALHLLPENYRFFARDRATPLNAIREGQQLFAKKKLQYRDPGDLSQLLQEKDRLAKSLNQYQAMLTSLTEEKKDRLAHTRIMAATADGVLTKVPPDGNFTPRHVFLDEAGYCALIKAAPLTAYGCPLTLLGDHMQLPPVCEINDDKIKEEPYRSIALWAQSALFLEDFLSDDFPSLCQRYLNHEQPQFRLLQKTDLTHSFRFSSELAAILAGNVYSEALQGTDEHHTEILYIDVPSSPQIKKRTAPGECEAIRRYITECKDISIGVITPYNNQKRLLKHELPPYIEVSTVHGAQGREWDCVILSVVDSTDKWFTNSLSPISNGKKVVNTAVSRAKKRLILVCDAEYWKTQPRQLIGKLLSIAKEIK